MVAENGTKYQALPTDPTADSPELQAERAAMDRAAVWADMPFPERLQALYVTPFHEWTQGFYDRFLVEIYPMTSIWPDLEARYKALGGREFNLTRHAIACTQRLTPPRKERTTKADVSPQRRELRVRQLSTVQPERLQWLWRPYLPLGRPVELAGDPGVGKSSLVAKIIAHLTSGLALPNVLDGEVPHVLEPCNVCLLTAEDDGSDTVLPRIVANGGDPARVYLIDGWQAPDGEQGVVTLQDLALLTDALERYTPRLFVFDPLQAYLGRGVDMNAATDTRAVLDPIVALCKRYACTPLFVRHVGKSRHEQALHAGLGSIDISAAMRSVLFLGKDPEEGTRRILAQSKSNSAALGASLAYKIVSVEVHALAPDGAMVTVEAPRLDWDGRSALMANDLHSPPVAVAEEETGALDQAKAFITELLTDGPVLSDDVWKAAKSSGIAKTTVSRAKALMNVQTRRQSKEGMASREWPWEWYLAPDPHAREDVRARVHLPDEILETLEKLPIKSSTYSRISRISSEILETLEQPQQNQQLALESLESHPQGVRACASETDDDDRPF